MHKRCCCGLFANVLKRVIPFLHVLDLAAMESMLWNVSPQLTDLHETLISAGILEDRSGEATQATTKQPKTLVLKRLGIPHLSSVAASKKSSDKLFPVAFCRWTFSPLPGL